MSSGRMNRVVERSGRFERKSRGPVARRIERAVALRRRVGEGTGSRERIAGVGERRLRRQAILLQREQCEEQEITGENEQRVWEGSPSRSSKANLLLASEAHPSRPQTIPFIQHTQLNPPYQPLPPIAALVLLGLPESYVPAVVPPPPPAEEESRVGVPYCVADGRWEEAWR